MQFSKPFGVTLLAMASSAKAQVYNNVQYAGYIPRTNQNSYWTTDTFQANFEGLMSSESCPDVETARLEWVTPGTDATYLQSIPTQPAPASKEWKEFTKYYKKFDGTQETDNDEFHLDWVNAAFNCGTTAGFVGPSAAFDPDFNAAYCGNSGNFFPSPTGYQVGAAGAAGTEVVLSKECVGIEESVKKATSYVFQFIEVVQLCEKAIISARSGSGCNLQRDQIDGISGPCTDAVDFWDAAAAIFTGSLEGELGALPVPSSTRVTGKSFYTLGEKRCRNFGTCGPKEGDLGAPDKYNTASINSKIMQYFAAGSHAAYSGDHRRMEYFKRKISTKMMVPWTQGVFRYAHRLSSSTTDPTSREHKEIAELSTFALGALPKLWACSKKANDAVAPFFRTGRDFGIGNEIDYIVIKNAFECNYACLGITCEEVGALYDVDLPASPKPDAEACKDKDNLSGDKEVALCTKPNSKYNKKCRNYIGQSGISGRTNRDYFVV